MRLLLLVLIGFSMALGVTSCKRECNDPTNPDCENYNPCHNSQKLTADFDIYEIRSFSSDWIPYDTDSLFATDARFVAKETGVEHEWKIGSETITTKEVTRKNFPNDVGIPITLTVKRKEGFNCHPEDSMATITRIIRVVDLEHLRFRGCFQGYHTNTPNDTFTVCIMYDTLPWPQSKTKTRISGLIQKDTCPDNTFIVSDREDFGYQQYIFNTSDGKCFSPRGRVRVDSAFTNSIRIDYSYFNSLQDPQRTIHKSFIGKRIN